MEIKSSIPFYFDTILNIKFENLSYIQFFKSPRTHFNFFLNSEYHEFFAVLAIFQLNFILKINKKYFIARFRNHIPIGEKRKPGRPAKAKQALIVQHFPTNTNLTTCAFYQVKQMSTFGNKKKCTITLRKLASNKIITI
ncbi:hypothetical protein BpHYR1_048615 [Brachionus plicatilis]|uniref:Uncharacterized protein n=1 Tax=Brachionus plicatilis TaxID=10195 RepID=A0A3M7RM69_BRAPC|nr:hypothetical protein BpHYR1_048615 [Brachionus plicatilis]